jgi:hypothetical protein
MGLAFFVSLGIFGVAGAMLARSQPRYLQLYREQHRSETLPWADDQPWHWKRDGRVTSSLFHVLSTRQNSPDLERRRVDVRCWQLATLGALALTFVLGFATQAY